MGGAASCSQSRLYRAVKKNKEAEIPFLLEVKKVNPNHIPQHESEPVLAIACKQNNLPIVRELITNKDHPADPNAQDADGLSIFNRAVRADNMELVKLLLD